MDELSFVDGRVRIYSSFLDLLLLILQFHIVLRATQPTELIDKSIP